MDDEEHPKEFPDVNQKLAAPKKLSAFEKERQAAQAKERRAEAENAAALKAFEDSFADDDEDGADDAFSRFEGGRGPPTGPAAGPGYPRGAPQRFGMPPTPRSGPGSLGPLSGPPPPPSLKRKRALDEMREAQEARREEDMLDHEQLSESGGTPQPLVQDDDRGLEAPRPTVQLSSLPPSMSSEEVISLLGSHVKVHSVRFLPPAGPGSQGKRSVSAIVTLAADVTTAQIDTAVSAFKDRYVGRGFHLSISRHLSSAAVHPTVSSTSTMQSAEPFGAEKPREQRGHFSMRNAPPPMDHRGFAPPESYDSPIRPDYNGSAPPPANVVVRPPLTVEETKAVHTVVDALLLEPDPERALQTEALLMSLPEVQRDERFSFLYEPRNPAGVYYRYLLWSPEDIDEADRELKRDARRPDRIYEDVAIDWVPPHVYVPFPDLRSLDHAVTDMDYISSDEDSDDGGAERQFNSGREVEGGGPESEPKHLSPLKRARFVHLLCRLPTTNARLRKGDVARVTNSAITHAESGAEEIVDLLLLNVERPFSLSLAATFEDSDMDGEEEDTYEPDEDLSNLNSPGPHAAKDGKRDEDPSNAKLIALYLISDILSASSTAGARNAWKYRQLFETGLKHQRTFEHLGKLERELSWGRMKANQWQRKIGVVLEIWESWSVFSSEVHEELKRSFLEPPLSEQERAAAREEEVREEKRKQEHKMERFKKVEQVAPQTDPLLSREVADEASDSLPASIDRTSHDVSKDLANAEAPTSPHFGGLDGTSDTRPSTSESPSKATATNGKTTGPRRRMRAEDMFADSDKE